MTATMAALVLRRGQRVLAALVVAAIAGSAIASTAQARCRPLDLASLADAPDRVVVAGTVLQVTSTGTVFQVERWWGAEPRDVVAIVGGRGSADPGVVTSVDWTPRPGEAWLVVGQRQAPDTISTQACQQTDARPSTLQSAGEAFGPPQEPPFADPEPAPSDTEQPFPAAAVFVAAALLLGVFALAALLVRRRSGSSAP